MWSESLWLAAAVQWVRKTSEWRDSNKNDSCFVPAANIIGAP